MCGSRCQRCGEYESMSGSHPRGCALPAGAREKIYYCGLPVDVAVAALAGAEDRALETMGKESLMRWRRDDAVERAESAAERPSNTVPAGSPVYLATGGVVAGGVFVVPTAVPMTFTA